MEKAVGIAAMVKTKQLPMEKIADELRRRLGVYTKVAGVEAVMATPVSYTHLDVYKRQVQGLLSTRSPLETAADCNT